MKVLALLSGGIDSPAAISLMQKQGCEVAAAYFDNGSFSGESTKKRAQECAKLLGIKELYIIPQGASLQAYAEKCNRRYGCIFCKRMMLRVAEKLARRIGAEALLTGDLLGQVASQTPENLAAENASVEIPILRPLIGFNKEEAIAVARKAGTFSTSIQPAACCTMVQKRPATRARLADMEAEEAKLDIEALINAELEGARKALP